MQAFDLEIGQQFCRVDAASQSVENSSPVGGTSAAAKWAPLTRSCHCGSPPRPALVLPAAWQPSRQVLQGVCPWGVTQGSKPDQQFGRTEGLRWAWGGREGQPSRGISATKGAGVCGSKQGVFGGLRVYSKTKVMKRDVMLRDEIVQKYKRKHRDACPAKSSFWQCNFFTKQLRGNNAFCKRDLPTCPAKWLM